MLHKSVLAAWPAYIPLNSLLRADYYAALYVKTSIRGFLIRAKVTVYLGPQPGCRGRRVSSSAGGVVLMHNDDAP